MGRVAAGCAPRRRGEGSADTRAAVVIAQHETIHSSNGRSFRIASATPADVPELHALIAGLADYERLTGICVATQHDLEQALFGEVRCAEALIARVDANHQEAAGFALFFHTYSTFLGRRSLWLEDLFVRPDIVAAAWGGVSPRARGTRAGAEVRSLRMGGARLEHARDPVLRIARCDAAARLADRARHGRRARRDSAAGEPAGYDQPSESECLTVHARRCRSRRLDIDADFWSLRFVEETCESLRRAQERRACRSSRRTDRGVMAHRLRRRRLRLRRHRRHVRRRARAPRCERAARTGRAPPRRSRSSIRARCRARRRAATTRRPSIDAAAAVAPRLVRPAACASRAAAAIDPRIVDWEAIVDVRTATHRLVTSDGGDVVQRYRFLYAVDQRSPRTPTATRRRARCNGYRGICQQGGVEILDALRLRRRRAARRRRGARARSPRRTARAGTMDVLLMPDQMMLQIHESIGHPLELDRILGDERNFAGTSFVTPDMFGTLPLRLRAPQRHVRPDAPRGARELRASTTTARRAEKSHLIRDGILERPLGGAISQARAGLAGRRQRARRQLEPPADRPHGQPQPRAGRRDVRRAGRRHRARRAACETNRSWSIDDSRNKFQFGCERGQRDRERQARRRGEEPQLPRHLARTSGAASRSVGDADTLQVLGTPYCGKGEPSQVDPRRPRVAGVRVRRRRRVRRRSMSAAGERERRHGSYFHELAAALDGALVAGERYTACVRRRGHRLRPDEPRQGAPAGHASTQRYLDVRLIRGAAPRVALALADRRSARRSRRDRARRSRRCATRCRDSPTIRTCCCRPTSRSTRADARRRRCRRRKRSSTQVLDAARRPRPRRPLRRRDRCIAASPTRDGQRNWHEATTFNLQWSLYHRADKAVKSGVRRLRVGRRGVRRARWTSARERLALISRPPRSLAPGKYRAYLAPAAMEEIAGTAVLGRLLRRARSRRSRARSRGCSDGDARSIRACTIAEDTAGGVAPRVPGAKASRGRRACR